MNNGQTNFEKYLPAFCSEYLISVLLPNNANLKYSSNLRIVLSVSIGCLNQYVITLGIVKSFSVFEYKLVKRKSGLKEEVGRTVK